jgi:WD repeat and SOF domain-containing protein 1
MSSIYFASQRPTGGPSKSRLTNGLPTYSSAVQEKLHNSRQHSRTSSWFLPVSVPIPGVQTRKLRMLVPNPARLHKGSVTRFGRKRGTTLLCIGLAMMLFIIFAFRQRFASDEHQWPSTSFSDPSTLVFQKTDLQRIWKWEIESGHYPSSRKRKCLDLVQFICF